MTFYHGTSEENWKAIQEEGILFGRRYIVGEKGEIVREISRCTYLAVDEEEASCYGNVVLKVEYTPFDEKGNIKSDSHGTLNNYIPDCWEIRVYEPIPIENVQHLK